MRVFSIRWSSQITLLLSLPRLATQTNVPFSSRVSVRLYKVTNLTYPPHSDSSIDYILTTHTLRIICDIMNCVGRIWGSSHHGLAPDKWSEYSHNQQQSSGTGSECLECFFLLKVLSFLPKNGKFY